MWTDLEKVAPDDISTDVSTVAAAWNTSVEAGMNRDAYAAFSNALLNGPALGRVSEYIAANCGPEFAGSVGEEAAADQDEIVLDDSWTDNDGYEYRVLLFGPTRYTPITDTANAAPGQSLFGFTHELSGILINETEGHNAQPGQVNLVVGWPDGSTACDAIDKTNSDNTQLAEGFCGRAFEVNGIGDTLFDGESANFTGQVGTIYSFVINEEDISMYETAFATPPVYAIATKETGFGSTATTCVATVQTACR
jgi:hypothetical protein